LLRALHAVQLGLHLAEENSHQADLRLELLDAGSEILRRHRHLGLGAVDLIERDADLPVTPPLQMSPPGLVAMGQVEIETVRQGDAARQLQPRR
jgi:hypothetical protein